MHICMILYVGFWVKLVAYLSSLIFFDNLSHRGRKVNKAESQQELPTSTKLQGKQDKHRQLHPSWEVFNWTPTNLLLSPLGI